jgi:hypothetical protein
MRAIPSRIIGLAALCALIACDGPNEPAPSPPRTLVSVPVVHSGGTAELLDGVVYSLGIRPRFPEDAAFHWLFEDVTIRNEDDGTALVRTAVTDPDFTPFAALITNGIDDLVFDGVWMGSGGIPHESTFFIGRPSSRPDFRGYMIDSLVFRVDSVVIARRGSDFWTDYHLRGRVIVVGHPN